MSKEKKITPNTDAKSTDLEKSVKIDLYENKLPDFKFTPVPPPATPEPPQDEIKPVTGDK
jgi:hypothetical protein